MQFFDKLEAYPTPAKAFTTNRRRRTLGQSKTQTSGHRRWWIWRAAGATHSYFGHDDWEQLAPGLKTIEDATAIVATGGSATSPAWNEGGGFQLGFQIYAVIALGTNAVFGLLPVLAHHDDRCLYGCQARQESGSTE